MQGDMPGVGAEEMVAREQARVQALDDIGLHLEKLKDEAVQWRAQHEIEWTQDYLQYNLAMRAAMADSKRTGSSPQGTKEASYRQTADNITRSKVIITSARLGDMLFPTNEANWALDITPKPDIPDAKIPTPPPVDDGQGNMQAGQWTPEQLLEAKREVARGACTSMSDTIKDQLGESLYDEQGRAAIFDGCLYGTGVLRGPVLKSRCRHTYSADSGYNRQMIEAAVPTVEHVDLWSFFPQPSRNMEECEHAFRLHILPPRMVRKLVRSPGFDALQIARLLKEQPVHGALVTAAVERGAIRPDANAVLTGRYAVWEYRGPMPKSAFAAFVDGVVAQGVITFEQGIEILNELDNDPLSEIDCEVWFSQGKVIKMALSTLTPGDLGYYVFNYEPDPNSLFGHGVAFLCRDDQHAVNQLWHAMMLNSMMSAGPQIGVRKGSVVPQPGEGRDGNFAADKPRVWALSDDTPDITKAFSVFIIPNVTDKIMGLYERTKQNADEHTMTPLIAQGEPTQAVPTSSGMAMLMNAANVVMRRLAKAWDDGITVPLINAFYDWNMAHNPDDSIRGDYNVIPKGASHLLIKDVQAQHIQFATQLFSTNPILQPYMKAGPFARKNIEILDLAPSEMLYTDDEVRQAQQAQGQQPNPDVIKAQALMAQAQASDKRAEADVAMSQHKMEFETNERNLSHQERMADINARENIQSMQLQVSQNQLYLAMAQMQSDERIAMQQMIVDLQKHAGQLDLGQLKLHVGAQTDAEKIASQERAAQLQAEATRAAAKAKPAASDA